MKFKKIGEDKIRCVITKEEMEMSGMELGDFVSDQEKTQSFIRDILAEACETLGIETHAKAYSVQMTVMPQGDVALLISPDSSSGLATAIEELKKHLTGLQETLSTTKNTTGSTPAMVAAGPGTADVPVQKAQAITDDTDEVTAQYLDTPLWAILPDLDAAILLCKHLPKYDGMQSALYRYGDDYYIKLNFELTRRQISAVILVLAEFATQMFTESFDGAFLLEHGDLICDDCVNVLSQV
ncbi:adaptor protein MecA [Pseudobutyrivibrio sp.]|uniref:adaptor protein MecA n=1 Tax=Pseudobutyrivibrio sp. TaxID=2014367 RepID=UPI001B210BB7|nr:adaptor protein MecA [Pseudobutyrivibrio sp.]MBO6282376.1 adaptor protein MecA [Pseudobutyrivibrio sp.]MBP3728194.1 adaptor protein MecA [Pseudobutyrivibrio sp.]MBQ8489835.1 adaptor protein MecA [Pseudobutyrivibrio sp.]